MKIFEGINLLAFTSVLLAAVMLGFIAHELVHLALISDISSIVITFGSSKSPLGICCLSEGELAMEELAYLAQFIVTLSWVAANHNLYVGKNRACV